ncbi:MAG: macro domain-containing protein, partial [Clostridia bacterium]|nr:macro domain-containing protein [Clostridia bacterium]
MPFQIIRNDITKVHADAIVNTANPEPIYASGTDMAVYQAAGARQLLAARRKIGPIPTGEVAVTEGFNLPADFIIHTVGPAWWDGTRGEFEALASCYRKSLLIAQQLGCK